MARRTAQELIAQFQTFSPDVSTAEYVQMLEDITDSVGDVDMTQWVGKAEYDSVAAERDRYRNEAQDYRDRYINRFYNDYDAPNNKGYIAGEASQEQIERDEKEISYDDLFE